MRGEEQQQPSCRILCFLNLTMHRTARGRRGKRRRRRRSSSSSSISRRLPSMTRHGKDPGDRRRSVSEMECESQVPLHKFRCIQSRFLSGVCVECLIVKQNKPTLFKVTEPSSVPYRAPPACAKMVQASNRAVNGVFFALFATFWGKNGGA